MTLPPDERSSRNGIEMPAIESPHTTTNRVHINRAFLLRQYPTLVHVRRKRRTWDEHGQKVVRDFFAATKPRTRVNQGDFGFDVSTWKLAKELVHAAITTEDPAYDGIRKRLGNLQIRPTAALVSTLGMWMAGVLGLSITATGPMLATMLYGVSEASGNWEILRESPRSAFERV